MLKSIAVCKLFGMFDYKLVFTSAGIMIITGPNGYGKSTILKMINAICNEDLKTILDCTFESFSLESDNKKYVIGKANGEFVINNIKLKYPDLEEMSAYRDINKYIRYNDYFMSKYIRAYSNTESNMNKYNIIDAIQNKPIYSMLFYSNMKSIGTDDNNAIENIYKTIYNIIEIIQDVKREIGSVYYITEQRLIEKKSLDDETNNNDRERIKYVSVIEEDSRLLKNALVEVMKNHSTLSSDLDGSYVRRLFDSDDEEKTKPELIRNKLKELQIKQEKLQKFGLAEAQKTSQIANIIDIDENKIEKYSKELMIYISDANEKYNIFQEIINKIELYEDIVNAKLMYKKMKVSSGKGISIISESGRELSLTALSSGEQEILVLFYKLIFESNVNLLLIDEPEISLHIVWQREIMNDIKRIVNQKKNMQVIVATHSPQIIVNNLDLQIDLGGMVNG